MVWHRTDHDDYNQSSIEDFVITIELTRRTTGKSCMCIKFLRLLPHEVSFNAPFFNFVNRCISIALDKG